MNSKCHLILSLIKSGLRILASMAAIMKGQWEFLAIGYGIAEFLGVFEELVDKR